MEIVSRFKHLIHCCVLISAAYGQYHFQSLYYDIHSTENSEFGIYVSYFIYILKFLIIFSFPQTLFNFFGLFLYNAFKKNQQRDLSNESKHFIYFRVVTKGDYANLVKNNLQRNIEVCNKLGLKNFIFQIVTDKKINLIRQDFAKEIVVPEDYETKNKSLFKARALQYCLEFYSKPIKEVNWIVHLDEETLLGESSVIGISDFVLKNESPFGQGIITYANEGVVNWFTTLSDCFRVTEDYGKIKFQFRAFRKPLLGIKGSFLVAKVDAEKDVSFDHGLEGSIAEDCYFAMIASQKNYKFSFIEGEMYEKSTFSISDYIKQRKRWFQGISLTVNSSSILLKTKFLLAISFLSWVTLPLTLTLIPILTLIPNLPNTNFYALDICSAFVAGIRVYMCFFGALKNFNLNNVGFFMYILLLIASVLIIPLTIIVESIAVVLGLFGRKDRFYIVKKH